MHRGCNSPHSAYILYIEDVTAHTATVTAHKEAETVHTATVTSHMAHHMFVTPRTTIRGNHN